MAQTFNRICLRDWSIEAQNGDRLDLKRGKEYLTSAPRPDGNVVVFSTFWVPVPLDVFGGEIQFTPPDSGSRSI